MRFDWFGTVRSFSDSRVLGSAIAERRMGVRCVFYAWFALSLCVTGIHAAPRYKIIALDVLAGGVDSYATGISETGVVVGHSTRNRSGNVGSSRPVIWDASGQPTELWPGSAIDAPGAIPAGINSAGQVVGIYGDPSSETPFPGPGLRGGRLFIWDGASGMRDLESFGEVAAINEAGQVAGTSGRLEVVEIEEGNFQEQFIPHPFIWSEEEGIRDLGSLGGLGSFATAINNQGQVVGYTELPSGYNGAFIWDEAVGMRQLESTPGFDSQAIAINDLGQVLGHDFGKGPVIWDSISGVESIPIGGVDINNRGQVLGGDTAGNPAIWDPSSGMHYLADLFSPNSGWKLEYFAGLNDVGEIAGYGILNDQIRGFLLIPVPEPSTVTLVVLTLLLISISIRFGALRRRIC